MRKKLIATGVAAIVALLLFAVSVYAAPYDFDQNWGTVKRLYPDQSRTSSLSVAAQPE